MSRPSPGPLLDAEDDVDPALIYPFFSDPVPDLQSLIVSVLGTKPRSLSADLYKADEAGHFSPTPGELSVDCAGEGGAFSRSGAAVVTAHSEVIRAFHVVDCLALDVRRRRNALATVAAKLTAAVAEQRAQCASLVVAAALELARYESIASTANLLHTAAAEADVARARAAAAASSPTPKASTPPPAAAATAVDAIDWGGGAPSQPLALSSSAATSTRTPAESPQATPPSLSPASPSSPFEVYMAAAQRVHARAVAALATFADARGVAIAAQARSSTAFTACTEGGHVPPAAAPLGAGSRGGGGGGGVGGGGTGIGEGGGGAVACGGDGGGDDGAIGGGSAACGGGRDRSDGRVWRSPLRDNWWAAAAWHAAAVTARVAVIDAARASAELETVAGDALALRAVAEDLRVDDDEDDNVTWVKIVRLCDEVVQLVAVGGDVEGGARKSGGRASTGVRWSGRLTRSDRDVGVVIGLDEGTAVRSAEAVEGGEEADGEGGDVEGNVFEVGGSSEGDGDKLSRKRRGRGVGGGGVAGKAVAAAPSGSLGVPKVQGPSGKGYSTASGKGKGKGRSGGLAVGASVRRGPGRPRMRPPSSSSSSGTSSTDSSGDDSDSDSSAVGGGGDGERSSDEEPPAPPRVTSFAPPSVAAAASAVAAPPTAPPPPSSSSSDDEPAVDAFAARRALTMQRNAQLLESLGLASKKDADGAVVATTTEMLKQPPPPKRSHKAGGTRPIGAGGVGGGDEDSASGAESDHSKANSAASRGSRGTKASRKSGEATDAEAAAKEMRRSGDGAPRKRSRSRSGSRSSTSSSSSRSSSSTSSTSSSATQTAAEFALRDLDPCQAVARDHTFASIRRAAAEASAAATAAVRAAAAAADGADACGSASTVASVSAALADAARCERALGSAQSSAEHLRSGVVALRAAIAAALNFSSSATEVVRTVQMKPILLSVWGAALHMAQAVDTAALCATAFTQVSLHLCEMQLTALEHAAAVALLKGALTDAAFIAQPRRLLRNAWTALTSAAAVAPLDTRAQSLVASLADEANTAAAATDVAEAAVVDARLTVEELRSALATRSAEANMSAVRIAAVRKCASQFDVGVAVLLSRRAVVRKVRRFLRRAGAASLAPATAFVEGMDSNASSEDDKVLASQSPSASTSQPPQSEPAHAGGGGGGGTAAAAGGGWVGVPQGVCGALISSTDDLVALGLLESDAILVSTSSTLSVDALPSAAAAAAAAEAVGVTSSSPTAAAALQGTLSGVRASAVGGEDGEWYDIPRSQWSQTVVVHMHPHAPRRAKAALVAALQSVLNSTASAAGGSREQPNLAAAFSMASLLTQRSDTDTFLSLSFGRVLEGAELHTLSDLARTAETAVLSCAVANATAAADGPFASLCDGTCAPTIPLLTQSDTSSILSSTPKEVNVLHRGARPPTLFVHSLATRQTSAAPLPPVDPQIAQTLRLQYPGPEAHGAPRGLSSALLPHASALGRMEVAASGVSGPSQVGVYVTVLPHASVHDSITRGLDVHEHVKGFRQQRLLPLLPAAATALVGLRHPPPGGVPTNRQRAMSAFLHEFERGTVSQDVIKAARHWSKAAETPYSSRTLRTLSTQKASGVEGMGKKTKRS